jgi:hypothetical protein
MQCLVKICAVPLELIHADVRADRIGEANGHISLLLVAKICVFVILGFITFFH